MTNKERAELIQSAIGDYRAANADGVPCIIDHTQRGGPFIPLQILSEGWGI